MMDSRNVYGVGCVGTAIFKMFIMGTGRRFPATPPKKRYSGISREMAAALQQAMETARMAFCTEIRLVAGSVCFDHGCIHWHKCQ